MNSQKILIGSRKKAFPHDIIMLHAEVNYTQIYFVDGKSLIVATCIKTLEKRLISSNFFRTHKAFLVNLDYVKSFEKQASGGIIEMSNKQNVAVSRRKCRVLKKQIFLF